MNEKKYIVLSLLAFLILMPMSVYSFGPGFDDGESCNNNMDCDSNRCRNDYNATNGKFCASISDCVHLIEGNVTADLYNDGDTSEDYFCNNGNWELTDLDHDGVLNADDLCPGTTIDCNISNSKIDPSNGCPFDPYSFSTSIDSVGKETCIIGSFGILAEPLCGADPTTLITYTLGGIGKNTCDTNGDIFWPWPEDETKNMCPIEDLDTPGSGTFSLYADYTYQSSHNIYLGEIIIEDTCSTNTACSLGWFLQDEASSLSITPTFTGSYVIDGSEYIVCPSTNVSLTGIGVIVTECSNGGTESYAPGVVGWLSYNGADLPLSINNGNSLLNGRCMSRTLRRDDLFGPTSLDIGYFPDDSCASPLLSGTTTYNEKTNSYSLRKSGIHNVVVDIVNAYCKSPTQFICPWNDNTERSTICEVGSMADWEKSSGWEHYATFNIRSINPDVNITEVTKSFVIPASYDPTIKETFIWSIENNGTGDIHISDIKVECPENLDCELFPPSNTELVISEGDAPSELKAKFKLMCKYASTDYKINLTYNIEDNYGLDCDCSRTESVISTISIASVSDESENVCRCYTGEDDLWDDGSKCCDPTDCWASEDRSWICNGGERLVEGKVCEKYMECGVELYWDGSTWHDKIPPGCSCSSSDECDNSTCTDGICMDLQVPDISFDSIGSITSKLGDTVSMSLILTNNLPVKDSIKVSVYSDPERLSYWTRFSNNDNTITIPLDPFEKKNIPMSVFCGEKGVFTLKVVANSQLSSSLYGDTSKTINVVADNSGGFNSRSPGISSLAVLLIIVIALMLSSKERLQTHSV